MLWALFGGAILGVVWVWPAEVLHKRHAKRHEHADKMEARLLSLESKVGPWQYSTLANPTWPDYSLSGELGQAGQSLDALHERVRRMDTQLDLLMRAHADKQRKV